MIESNQFLAPRIKTDFPYLVVCDGSIGPVLSPAHDAPPFGVHVIGIVGISAQKEMSGIDARGNVAFVADEYPFRNRPAVSNPGQPMGKVQFPFPSHSAMAKIETPAEPQLASTVRFRHGMKVQPFRKCHGTRRPNVLGFRHGSIALIQRLTQGRRGVGSASAVRHSIVRGSVRHQTSDAQPNLAGDAFRLRLSPVIFTGNRKAMEAI